MDRKKSRSYFKSGPLRPAFLEADDTPAPLGPVKGSIPNRANLQTGWEGGCRGAGEALGSYQTPHLSYLSQAVLVGKRSCKKDLSPRNGRA